MKTLKLFSLVVVLFSCGQLTEKELNGLAKNEPDQMLLADISSQQNTFINAQIRNEICREMKSHKAVSWCRVYWEEQQKINKVEVAYQGDELSAGELLAEIQSVRPGELLVVASEMKSLVPKNNDVKQKEQITNDSQLIQAEEAPIEAPNFLELFSRLIPG